jgi:cystathionine gamma-synthase
MAQKLPHAAGPRRQGENTRSVHAGERRPYSNHSLIPPIVQTATYTFDDTEDLRTFMDARLWGPVEGRIEYGRYGNPTVTAVERKLAALDRAEEAILLASGMSALTTTLLALLKAGDHLVITDDAYRRTRQFCLTLLKRFDVACSVVAAGDLELLQAAIQPQTRLIVSESPTNPYLRVLDLEHLAHIGRARNVKTLIDSTFASPINQRPLEYGIDLVVHSGTKYLAGHNDVLAGSVAGSASLIALIRQALWVLGGIADPHAAFLLYRGLKTLALRVRQQNRSAQRVAESVRFHPAVERVWYPGLPSHPDHKTAVAQMSGFGGVVSLELRTDLSGTSRFIDAVTIPLIASSLGGVESLIEQPALMSYYELSTEERLAVGIKENLVRLSVGVEDPEDLIHDLTQALAQI